MSIGKSTVKERKRCPKFLWTEPSIQDAVLPVYGSGIRPPWYGTQSWRPKMPKAASARTVQKGEWGGMKRKRARFACDLLAVLRVLSQHRPGGQYVRGCGSRGHGYGGVDRLVAGIWHAPYAHWLDSMLPLSSAKTMADHRVFPRLAQVLAPSNCSSTSPRQAWPPGRLVVGQHVDFPGIVHTNKER